MEFTWVSTRKVTHLYFSNGKNVVHFDNAHLDALADELTDVDAEYDAHAIFAMPAFCLDDWPSV